MVNRSLAGADAGTNPNVPVMGAGHAILKFRFIPDSYLAAVDAKWDSGFDQLLYLQMFIEDETEEYVK